LPTPPGAIKEYHKRNKGMAIVRINKDNYDTEVIRSDKPVLLDFAAPWCVPCRAVAKIIEELDLEQNAVKIAKVDVDECPEIAAAHGVMSIPVLILFKDGKPVDRLVGAKPKAAVIKMIGKSQ
jgi:thioredoxin 1